MVKIVKRGYRDCTVTLNGSECVVEFASPYRVFSVMNMSDSDIVMSIESGRTAGDDGVRIVKAGCCGMLAHMRSDINTVYITGTGKVHISAGNEAVLPFKMAAEGGETKYVTVLDGDLNYDHQKSLMALGLISNVKMATSDGNCGYNLASDVEHDKLLLSRVYGGDNITHTYAIDVTPIKRIIIFGATKSNLSSLTTKAYCYLSPEVCNEINDDWELMGDNVGDTDLHPFFRVIDCSEISGNYYLHLAVEHGTEISGYTSYLYIDEIEFVYD